MRAMFPIVEVPVRLKGKGSPYSNTECRVPELIPILGSQPAGDVSLQCAAVESGRACTAVTEHPVGRPIDRSGQAHHVGLAIDAPLAHDGPRVLFALSIGLFSNLNIHYTMDSHVFPCPNYQSAVSNIYWCCCGSGAVSAGRPIVLV